MHQRIFAAIMNQMEDAVIAADLATHAAQQTCMDTDLEVITLRESQQTALEVKGAPSCAD